MCGAEHRRAGMRTMVPLQKTRTSEMVRLHERRDWASDGLTVRKQVTQKERCRTEVELKYRRRTGREGDVERQWYSMPDEASKRGLNTSMQLYAMHEEVGQHCQFNG